MKITRLTLAFLVFTLFLGSCGPAQAQRRGRRDAAEPWPPARSYSRTSLGMALQRVFERHYDFCGFAKPDARAGRRDYTPPTIAKFLGRRSLRTPVEAADINGGNLLAYIFAAEETQLPLDEIRYRSDHLLYSRAEGVDLLPEARPGFDAFVLTKNCSGYLKASLDAGFQPPYAAFAAALDTDDRRSSSVLAMAGSFESPLADALARNDTRTTELMLRLWQYYQDHPELRGQAYYLRQFDGVLVKHLTDAIEVVATEQRIGVNVSLPLVPKLSSSLAHGRTHDNAFSGTDWETLVFADFRGPYSRERLFAPFPSARDVARYFATQNLVSGPPPGGRSPLGEGGAHQHTVTVTGLPPHLANAGWRVDNVRSGPYAGPPAITVRPGPAGENQLSFTVGGLTRPALFGPQAADDVNSIPIQYDLLLPARNGVPDLRIPVEQRIPTTRHPLVDLSGSRFELRRRNNGQYAFQWYVTLDVQDRENPVDPNAKIAVLDLAAGYEDQPVGVQVVSTTYDPRRQQISLLLETSRSWELADVDDRRMSSVPLALAVGVPVQGGHSLCRRTVDTRIALPRIAPAPLAPLPGN